jgi:hypothetical protein
MNESQVQYISDDQGEVTGVILPIQLWRDIVSELETQHLMKSDAMWQRLIEAKRRAEGIPFDTAINQLGLE